MNLRSFLRNFCEGTCFIFSAFGVALFVFGFFYNAVATGIVFVQVLAVVGLLLLAFAYVVGLVLFLLRLRCLWAEKNKP